MVDANTTTTWLTQEAHDKLTAELTYLKGEGRQKVSAKIAQAREEGDLSENGGYHAAREEQGHQEARIRQLAAILESAQVGEAPAAIRSPPAPWSPSTSTATRTTMTPSCSARAR